MKKYKRNILQPEVPQLPSLVSPLLSKKLNNVPSEKGKIQKRQYTKKKKIVVDVDDIYAVGQGIKE